MPSSIVDEPEVLPNAENSVALNVPDVDMGPQEPYQDEDGPLVGDAPSISPTIDPAEPVDCATEIEMVPAVSENGLVYRAAFASGGNRYWNKQFYSQWAWNLKPFTDVANAARLVERCGGDLHYCAAWKKWLVWDGRRWEVDRTGKVNERAKAVIEEMRKMIRYGPVEYTKHVRRTSNKSGFSAMIELAQTVPPIPVTAEQLDSNPWLLNCQNATIDLRTGQIWKHRREDLLTKIAPVQYCPEAKCPTFDAFLARILKHNTTLIEYLQRVVGYCLTGSDREKAMFVPFGEGNNGKTTFLEAIRNVLGDYAGQVPIQSLMKKSWGESIPNDIAQLQGKRFVTSSETESGQELAVAKIKHLTGLATLRFLYQEFFEFATTFLLGLHAK